MGIKLFWTRRLSGLSVHSREQEPHFKACEEQVSDQKEKCVRYRTRLVAENNYQNKCDIGQHFQDHRHQIGLSKRRGLSMLNQEIKNDNCRNT